MFEQFLTDKINVINLDGDVYAKDIKAQVNENTVNLMNSNLPIKEGEIIERMLPSGILERYKVLKTIYRAAFLTIPESIECQVEKEMSIKKEVTNSVTYNLSGHNHRIYNNSTDNSVNNITLNEANVFSELRKAVENIDKNNNLLSIIDRLETTKGQPSFNEAHKEFIGMAANYMTIISPFIPQITGFLAS